MLKHYIYCADTYHKRKTQYTFIYLLVFSPITWFVALFTRTYMYWIMEDNWHDNMVYTGMWSGDIRCASGGIWNCNDYVTISQSSVCYMLICSSELAQIQQSVLRINMLLWVRINLSVACWHCFKLHSDRHKHTWNKSNTFFQLDPGRGNSLTSNIPMNN